MAMAKKSGYKCVTQHAQSWQARVKVGAIIHRLGRFPFTERGALLAARKVAQFKKSLNRKYIKEHLTC